MFTLGTFNVRGLTKVYKQQQLSRDINKYKVDICCLQETKVTEQSDTDISNNRLILLKSDNEY